jgi:hypothetical protein
MKKRVAELRVIEAARLAYRGWISKNRNEMCEALEELGKAFDMLDMPPAERRELHRGGWGPPKPCRFCGTPRPTLKDGSLRHAWCKGQPQEWRPTCVA